MAIAGRVAIVPKGDWSADAAYKRLDAVTYNNTLYFAKKEVPAGTATSNTEYWSKSIVGGAGGVATADEAGVVKPADGLTVAEDGTLKVSIDGTTLTMDQVNNVIKLADTLKDKINGAFPAANLINNLTTTEAGFGLDARQGKALDDKITEINGSLSNFKVFTGNSLEALDAELSSIHFNDICYLAIIPGGSGMLLGYKNNSRYQRQLRITYWDNKIYSRVKNNSTEWSEWVTIT
jgi:hypothetical protein|nr:MAG TPA: hypothetical protein [Caudoviricetes sp.]